MSLFPRRVLVANRGEIARRVMRTARTLGIETVAVYHAVDANLPFVAEADQTVRIDGDRPVAAYLDRAQLIGAAQATGADAVHPGYGFLAEDPHFAHEVMASGLLWVGPPPDCISAMADKVEARRTVCSAGVPISGGADGALTDVDDAIAAARTLGYPVMIKAAAGGGGIGMAIAADEAQLRKAFAATRSMAERSFSSDRVFVERFLPSARHIEVQVLGLADGTVLALGERDCSVQRRHQKVVEESPAPHLSPTVRKAMHDCAVKAAAAVGYCNAGTVEFLVDTRSGDFVFLEMNTRIQVEHPITELTFGVDLVEQQLSIAKTGSTTPDFAPAQRGHAIELRVCAEDPERFFPSPGPIEVWEAPSGPGIRVDAGYGPGTTVTPYFDSLLAKLCVHAPTRAEAIDRALDAVDRFRIGGLTTNLPFLAQLLGSDQFAEGRYDTNIIADLRARQPA